MNFKYFFILPLWGQHYIDNFFDNYLPTYFSKGNLEVFEKDSVSFIFYTTKSSVDIIKNKNLFNKLFNVEFVLIDKYFELAQNKYHLMTLIHNNSIDKYFSKYSVFLFVMSDMIFSKNSFKYIKESINNQNRVIFVPSPPILGDKVIPLLNSKYREVEDIIEIDAVKLNEYSLNNLHPFANAFNWTNKKFANTYSNLYWKLNSGYLSRSLHKHPLAVRFLHKEKINQNSTIDADNLDVFQNMDRIDIVSHTKQFSVYSVDWLNSGSRSLDEENGFINETNYLAFANWVKKHAFEYQLKLLEVPTLMSYDSIDEDNYKMVLNESNLVIKILNFILKSDYLIDWNIIQDDFFSVLNNKNSLEKRLVLYKTNLYLLFQELSKEFNLYTDEDKNLVEDLMNSKIDIKVDKILFYLAELQNKIGQGFAFSPLFPINHKKHILSKIENILDSSNGAALFGAGYHCKALLFILEDSKLDISKIRIIYDDNSKEKQLASLAIKNTNSEIANQLEIDTLIITAKYVSSSLSSRLQNEFGNNIHIIDDLYTLIGSESIVC